MKFDGKVAFVTGGASGIGLATATELARRGAAVYIGDINEDTGRAAERDLEKVGKATFLRVDVTSEQSIADAVRQMQDKHERVDILINAAGWSKVERFSDTTPDLWRRLIELNYVGTLNTTRALLPQMTSRSAGKIVNVASDAGRVGSGGEAVYSGTKGAVIAFTKAIARETARYA
ncbi:MAG: putative alcohol dehydrogenase, partial [Betaproteobacteria bacterium]|nr:putative alcohol dehydrogenase [Betaproteobacteria bacterium]